MCCYFTLACLHKRSLYDEISHHLGASRSKSKGSKDPATSLESGQQVGESVTEGGETTTPRGLQVKGCSTVGHGGARRKKLDSRLVQGTSDRSPALHSRNETSMSRKPLTRNVSQNHPITNSKRQNTLQNLVPPSHISATHITGLGIPSCVIPLTCAGVTLGNHLG